MMQMARLIRSNYDKIAQKISDIAGKISSIADKRPEAIVWVYGASDLSSLPDPKGECA